jgi:hypothetical protein
VVDGPDQEEPSDSAQQGAGNQTRGTRVAAVAESIQPTQETQSVKEKWWRQPEHIIQVAILLFVASYTVLTFCIWQTSRDTEKRQLRAYVAVKSVKFDPGSVAIELDNSGVTPADDVKIFSNWQTRPIGQRNALCKDFSFPEQSQCDGDRSAAIVTPHNPLTTPNLICEKVRADGQQAQAGSVDWVLYGHITYEDVFKEHHASTFCDFISSQGAAICACHNEIDPKE